MRIIIDGMGGDNAPYEIVKGTVAASKKLIHELVLVGDEKRIKAELAKYEYDPKQITVVHASEKIENEEESPVKAIRRKKDSSMVVGLTMMKEGKGDVFVSAGNTGALMAGSLFILGRIQGIERPAIASVYPIFGKQASLLLDGGANADCKPSNLLQFGVMGSLYMERVLGREKPLVGLVNIGVEESKGNAMTKAAHELLVNCKQINFVGNVEAREVPRGAVDVIVCDGFTGNVILKLTEGLGFQILRYMKAKFSDGVVAKMGAALLLDKFRSIKDDFDYSSYGGAPILGVQGAVIKMHGSSKERAVKNAILMSAPFVEENIVGTIADAIEEIGVIEEKVDIDDYI